MGRQNQGGRRHPPAAVVLRRPKAAAVHMHLCAVLRGAVAGRVVLAPCCTATLCELRTINIS